MVASVLAFHLDNGSQQAGFHCLLSKARVSCTTKSPVLIFQLPSYSAHYSYTAPSPVRSTRQFSSSHSPATLRTKVALPMSRQFSSSHSPAALRTKFVLPSRQFSSSSSPLLLILKLYYKVASSQLLPTHQFSSSHSPATLRTKVVLPSRHFSSSSSPATPRTT